MSSLRRKRDGQGNRGNGSLLEVPGVKAQDRKILIRNAELSTDARFLWCVLETYANADGTNSHPSVKTLMEVTGRSDKWVEKYLRELKKGGFISIGKKIHKGPFAHNKYTLSPRGRLGGTYVGKIRTLYQVPNTPSDTLSVESEAILRVVPKAEEEPAKYGLQA